MTRDEIRAAAKRLVRWHQRFVGLFGRKEARTHSLTYLHGLLSDQTRKSVEPIALRFARSRSGGPATQNEVVAMQDFITASPWEAGNVFREIQTVFQEELAATAAADAIGTVGVIDESGFVKAGSESVGVAPQYCGRWGQTMNCQVGVFLLGVAPEGAALLDAQLYVPQEWIDDCRRRRKTRVPRNLRFQTKPQIAIELLRRTLDAGQVHFEWITADEVYGTSGELLDFLEARKQRYLLTVKKNVIVWTANPDRIYGTWPGPKQRGKPGSAQHAASCSVEQLAASLPVEAWRPLKLREGSNGPLVCEFAVQRVWAMRHGHSGPPIWLLVRRSLEKKADYWYYVSNASAETPWETLAAVSGARFRIEEFFEDAKMHLGMADYEVRSWTSWHHHMCLVALAHLYVTLTKRDLQRNEAELTLDMAIRLLRSAFDQPRLGPEDAIRLVEYHLRRNKIAYQSHRKSWLSKHKKLKKKLLL
jgi:SRSO17 transposase